MQLGSGTFDFKPGATIRGDIAPIFGAPLTWGLQAAGVVRAGTNDNDYTLGDQFRGDGWLSLLLHDSLSLSGRFGWQRIGNIDGADPLLNPTVVPTADPNLRGSQKVFFGICANTLMSFDGLSLRLLAEVIFPVEQDLDGPQLKSDISVVTALQATFS